VTRVALLAAVALVASSAVAAAASGPPVIKEPFTVLPCPAKPKTTLDLEGCAENALLASDKKIDAQVKAIWNQLSSTHARASFASGEQSWLAYRRSNCTAEASRYSGGSLEPVAFAQCEVARNKTHLAELGSMLRTLHSH
jgi:uncharacterized protein YecT (DUF1311 family)